MKKELIIVTTKLIELDDNSPKMTFPDIFASYSDYNIASKIVLNHYPKAMRKKLSKAIKIRIGLNNVFLSLWQLTKLYKLKRIKI